MNAQLNIPRERLEEFCRRWSITELSLFGSVLREDFHPESDVDMLVSFSENVHYSLLDMVRMQNELGLIFGREVDLVERTAVEKSRNYIRRKNVLSSVEEIYAR